MWQFVPLQVFPKSGTRKPTLLDRLQKMLEDRLRSAEHAALGPGVASVRSPMAATNLRLHAHRAVLDAFIQAFGTYAPLLTRIKVCRCDRIYVPGTLP